MHVKKETFKEKAKTAFYAIGFFFILLGVFALMEDTFRIMPLYMKAILLYAFSYGLVFLSNAYRDG